MSSQIKALTATINRQFGAGSVSTLDLESREEDPAFVPALSTGSLALDAATGIGGYPVGRVVEIYGPALAGKTTLVLHAIASAQRAGLVAAFVDMDHAFDVAYARAIGVEHEKLLVSQPDTAEQALEIAEVLVRSGAVGLVVVDSTQSLTPRAAIEGEIGEEQQGLQARLMSQALRKLTAIAHRTGTTILFVSRLREPRVNPFSGCETSGNALKFYASMRLDVRRVGPATLARVGGRTKVKIAKNKCAPPFTEAEFEINYGGGIDHAGELLELGVARGLVEMTGKHYSFAGRLLGSSCERAREALLCEGELRDTLRAAVLAWKAD